MALASKSLMNRAGLRPAQRRSVVARASSRPLWLPNTTAPKWLDGTMAGDNGFDPL